MLGSPNDNTGKLSVIAKSRCDKVLDVFQQDMSCRILCTGGFGEHFNTTTKPHAHYCQQYLQSKGIGRNVFYQPALSRYTLEDALLAKPILAHHKIDHIILVTSDFHLERALLVFSHVMPDVVLSPQGAKSPMSENERDALIAHEKTALIRERDNLKNIDNCL
ncbi:YdcF family protein [Thalassotalea sp. 1_MG-2023]|uniref:YdcF family protein n=1 Tax=Thalassotalea sp. 1_MG-2023 TaxID=3062680 RepID=UPI0026E3C874|nr:YdcF family protein [Thalassotalea sp. 1_MG-2023]MDO6428568.1 YdcF family protein [Thalassotalea sp. 1_MG-2023]